MKRYIVRKEVFEADVNTVNEAALMVEKLNKNLRIIGQDAQYLVWDTVDRRYLADSELFGKLNNKQGCLYDDEDMRKL